MSILDQQADLEGFSDQMLAQESQQPSGRYPLYLVASEVERRATLRQRYQAQAAKAQAAAPPIIEQRMAALQQGIPMADQGAQTPAQNNPALAEAMGGGIMQAQQPVQQFHEGGFVHAHPHNADTTRLVNVKRRLGDLNDELRSFGLDIVETSDGRFRAPSGEFSDDRELFREIQALEAERDALMESLVSLPVSERMDRNLPDRLPEEEPYPMTMPGWTPPWEREGVTAFGKMGDMVRGIGEFFRNNPGNVSYGIGRAPLNPNYAGPVDEPLQESPAADMSAFDGAGSWPGLMAGELGPEAFERTIWDPDWTQPEPRIPFITEWEQGLAGDIANIGDAQAAARGYLQPGIDASADLVGSIGETQDDLVNRMNSVAARRDDLAKARAAELGEMSAVERAYMDAMRDPEEAADSRRAYALAQLGALIGSSANLGEIPAGMGEIYRETRDMEEADRQERNQYAIAAAQATDARDAAQYAVLQQNLEAAGVDARTIAQMTATMTGAQASAINSMVTAARAMATGELEAARAQGTIRMGLAALQQWTTENIERDSFTRTNVAQVINSLVRFLEQGNIPPEIEEGIQRDITNLSRMISVGTGYDQRPGPVTATDEFIQQMEERLGGSP